jgi:hypothetical protein
LGQLGFDWVCSIDERNSSCSTKDVVEIIGCFRQEQGRLRSEARKQEDRREKIDEAELGRSMIEAESSGRSMIGAESSGHAGMQNGDCNYLSCLTKRIPTLSHRISYCIAFFMRMLRKFPWSPLSRRLVRMSPSCALVETHFTIMFFLFTSSRTK